MSKPGMIQRVGAEVVILQSETDPSRSAVSLLVEVSGQVEDRGDALLMIADAWVQLMIDEGFDPDKSFAHMRNHGRLN